MAGWRTIVITERCKLDLRYGNMNIRKNDILNRVNISEIGVLILESTSISITTALLSELMKNKIKVIFCDEQHNPQSELISYYGSHDCSERIKNQISWSTEQKESLWTIIVYEKIKKQMELLHRLGKEQCNLLLEYMSQIEHYDITNREGHSAKVYFNSLFGNDFTREDKENPINIALNYGYSLILANINREIVSNGCLTTLGIFHRNKFNQFNFSCDLMEPFRPIVDEIVYFMKLEKFEKEEKRKLQDIFKMQFIISDKKYYFQDVIKIYVKSVLDSLDSGNFEILRFYENEL